MEIKPLIVDIWYFSCRLRVLFCCFFAYMLYKYKLISDELFGPFDLSKFNTLAANRTELVFSPPPSDPRVTFGSNELRGVFM